MSFAACSFDLHTDPFPTKQSSLSIVSPQISTIGKRWNGVFRGAHAPRVLVSAPSPKHHFPRNARSSRQRGAAARTRGRVRSPDTPCIHTNMYEISGLRPQRPKTFLSPASKTPATMEKRIASYRLRSLLNPAGKINFEKQAVWRIRNLKFTLPRALARLVPCLSARGATARHVGGECFYAEINTGRTFIL
jgi:hypothetical protein